MDESLWGQFWNGLKVGEGIERDRMTIFPLYHSFKAGVDYLTLEEVAVSGRDAGLRVEEVSEAGSVNRVRLFNGSGKPILILEGELLLGAKQNRTVNATTLVKDGVNVVIPVACVEQGRWSHTRDRRFGFSPLYTHSKLRSDKLRHLAMKRMSMGAAARAAGENAFHVDQGAVWHEVMCYAGEVGGYSDTGDAQIAYETASRASRGSYDFEYPEGSAGVAVAIDGEFVALDCFDRPATMERLFPRLMSGYALDASRPHRSGEEERPDHRRIPAGQSAVSEFLREVGSSRPDPVPGLVLGEDLRAQSRDWCAAALAHEGGILHAELFPRGVV